MLFLKKYWVYFVGIILVTYLLIKFYYLSYNPYGWFFWSHLHLAILIIIGLLFIKTYKSFLKKKKTPSIIFGFLTFCFITLTIVMYSDYRTILFSGSQKELSSDEWKEDVLFLKQLMLEKHPKIESLISLKELDKEFNNLLVNLGNWSDNKIKTEIMRMVTIINDGHSIVPPQPAINFHTLPIVIHNFEDGVFIIDSGEPYLHLRNTKILSIGNLRIDKLFSKLKPFIGAENEGNKWDRFPLYAGLTELLYEIGVSKSPTEVEITYSKNGENHKEIIKGTPFYQWYYFYLAPNRKNNPLPYEHRMLNNSYWFNYDKTAQSLYVNVNNMKDQSSESLANFAIRLSKFADNNQINKVILDIRNNRGGDNNKSRMLANSIRENKNLNQYGKLFVLTSQRTFSAAVNLATLLENQTKAIFVGQPTGQGPTQFGDPRGFTLPNSNIYVFLSSLKWQGSLPQDKRQSIYPDFTVTYTFKDYLSGKDPALDLVKSLKITKREKPQWKQQDITGRYLMNDDQLVAITNDSLGLNFYATDYVFSSLRDIRSSLYPVNDSTYSGDLNGFKILKRNNSLSLKFYKDTILLKPVDKNFKLPMQLFADGDYEKGIKQVNKKIEKYKYLMLEAYFNAVGYQILREGNIALALDMFLLNTKLYPNSPNVWDSYGETLLQKGDIDGARNAYKKALKRNPPTKNAYNMLLRLN